MHTKIDIMPIQYLHYNTNKISTKSTYFIFIVFMVLSNYSYCQDTLKGPFDEGYLFVGPDDVLKFKGYAQADYYIPMTNTYSDSEFLIRRARIAATGYFQKNFRYMLYARFDEGNAELNEAFIESRHLEFAKLRVGQFKSPFSRSNLTSSSQLGFINRPVIIDEFAPGYDVGIMLFGKFWQKRLDYAVGIFNGRSLNQPENNSGKQFVGRLIFSPFKNKNNSILANLSAGFSFASENKEENLSNSAYENVIGIPFLKFPDNFMMKGEMIRFGSDFQWSLRNWKFTTEYLNTDFNGLRGDVEIHDLKGRGYYATVSVFLTGEENSVDIKPKKELDPKKGKWGAFEILGRFEKVNLSALPVEFNSVDQLSSFALGLNWYPNDDVKLMLNYQYFNYQPSINYEVREIKFQNAFLARVQFQF